MGQFDHVVVVGYGRSAVAKSGKKGALRNMHPVTMGGLTLKGVLERVPQLPVDQIDDLIVGCAIPERKQGFNMARLVAARAGLPDSVCGMTINRFCSSGLQAIALAAGQIACGVADVMVAGGVESMTACPVNLDISDTFDPDLLRQREEDARRAREFREQMQRAKENARSRGEAEAKRILRDARFASDAVFAELERMRKEQAKADRAINANEARAELRRQLNEAEDAIDKRDARSEPIPKPSRPIQKGDLVEIPGVSTPAEVVSVGGDGTLQLKAGILKMKAKADEVRLIEDDERAAMKKKAPKPTRTAVTGLRTAASRELDIRGMETLEAESVVETFLSTAVMGHLETVTIIHGKGTGALRNAVHDILRRNKNVKSFRLGVYGEGENGVTVVTMK